PRLVLFPTEYEIGSTIEKVSKALCGILKSLSIDLSSNEYVQIIRECFNSQYNSVHLNTGYSEDDLIHDNTIESTIAVEELLLIH
ncbi:10712_t:CDS:2, partial [Funneliformis caledonium]